MSEIGLNVSWMRTGIPQSARQRQRRNPKYFLTTPESLSLLLSYEDSDIFGTLQSIIIDELHAIAPKAELLTGACQVTSLAPYWCVGLTQPFGNQKGLNMA